LVAAESQPEEAARILVVDDERVIREILAEFLTLEGFSVHTVEDGEKALVELRLHPYDLLITDLKMPRLSGLQLLEKIEAERLGVLTVLMTGFGTVETAIEAMKKGAYDYILKPFKIEEVVHVVERGLDRQRLQAENIKLKEAVSLYKISEAISQSLSLDTVLDVILDAVLVEAQADLCTLMLQDPGTKIFIERTRRQSANVAADSFVGDMNLSELMDHYRSDRPILAHGIRALRFFSEPPKDRRLVSFCSIPLKVADRVIGMLNVYSYTRGNKFTEGQRKMLAVLASRAAVSSRPRCIFFG